MYLFAPTLVVLIAGSIWISSLYKARREASARQTMAAIAELKAERIAQWRQDRLGDAATLMEGPYSGLAVRGTGASARGEDSAALLILFRSLQQHESYADVLLVDERGRLLASLSGRSFPLDRETLDAVAAAIREHRAILSDLYEGPAETGPQLASIAPLFEGKGTATRPVGAIVMLCNARDYLFPLLQAWPIPNQTAETLLVRSDRSSVLYLNEPRFLKNAALRLRLPLNRPDLPGALAVEGRQGAFVGTDYRDHRVMAFLKKIPGSPWSIVTKEDTDEVLAPLRLGTLMILALVLLLVAVMAMVFVAIWQSGEKRRYRARYQAESAQRAAEERHRITLESIAEGVISIDADGRVEFLNTVAQSLTGWSQEEARGRPLGQVFQLLREGTRERIDDALSQVRREEAATGGSDHIVLVARNGEERTISDSSAPIRDAAGRTVGMVLVFRDVTKELRIRRERETSLNLLRLLNEQNLTHELVQNITALLQAWTGCEAVGVRLAKNGDFPYFETRGFPASFVEGERRLCERDASGGLVLDGKGEPVLECMCGNVLRGRTDPSKPFFTGKGSFRSNGTTTLLATTTDEDRMAHTRNRCNREGYESVALIPLRHGETTLGLLQLNDRRTDRFSPDLIAFLENAADQIAIALAQRQAQAARQQLAEAIAQAAEAIVITDPAGAIQYVNPAFEAITGYASAEVLGHNPRILRSGHQGADFYKDLWDTITRGRTWKGHFVNRKKDGMLYTEDATISAVHGPDGAIVNYVAVKRDVTREHQLEEQLRQAQKMESIGRLAGGVAHDFNNMLQVITSYTELSVARVESDSPIHRNLVQIGNAARRSADLVGQLLAFARKQTVIPRVIDVNESVAGTLKMLRRLIGEDIELTWTPGSDAGSIFMDPSQFDQILANLAVNARDAINGVGRLSISTGRDHSEGGFVTLTVSDTGCGMSRETLSHLFEPFYTTKEVGKGTGLGLATIYGIVSQNSGTINVDSELGRGTTFRIALPRVNAVPKPVRSPEPAPRETPHGSETVLVVEDETAILEIVLSILTGLGYVALGAPTPEDALRVAAEHAGAIQLLITDVVMPQMNGRELAARLAESNPDMKTIYMSGYTADVIASKNLLEQGTSFISKPFTPDDLARKIREALGTGS